MLKIPVFIFSAWLLRGSFMAAQVISQASIPAQLPSGAGIYDPSLNPKVQSLLRKMTLEEKVGQLVQYSAGQPTGPGTGRTDYEDMLAKGQIGALFNISTAKETNAYQRLAVEKSRLHIPILFGLDVIHGFRTEFPIPLALASTWDPQIVENAARVAAKEACSDRHSLDIFSNGRHCAGPALGAYHRRCGRRSLSRIGDVGGLRSRVSGIAARRT